MKKPMPRRMPEPEKKETRLKPARMAERRKKSPFKFAPEEIRKIAKYLKVVKKRKTPIKILIVCPEGIGFSYASMLNFNDLVRGLRLHGKIRAGFDSYRLDGHSREQLKEFDYIIPRYDDEAGFVQKNLRNRCQDSKAEFLENSALTNSTLLDPQPYKDFLIEILKKEADKIKGKK